MNNGNKNALEYFLAFIVGSIIFMVAMYLVTLIAIGHDTLMGR